MTAATTDRPDLSILVPVYNNERYLDELHQRVVSAVGPSGRSFELLLVNDGSQDGSWDRIAALADADPRVRGFNFSRNFGQHAAIACALDHARGAHLVLMDADLQDRPELIPELLDAMDGQNTDIAYTVREADSPGLIRNLTSRAFHSYVGRTTGSDAVRDIGTFRAFSSKVAQALRSHPERAVVYGPLMHTMGFRAAHVRVKRDPRVGSKSSYSFLRRLSLALQSLASYSRLPQQVLLGSGAAVASLTTIYLVVIVAQYLLGYGGLPEGLTLLVVLMLLLLGVLLLGLGLIASYLMLIYREVLGRPRYLVQQSLNDPGSLTQT